MAGRPLRRARLAAQQRVNPAWQTAGAEWVAREGAREAERQRREHERAGLSPWTFDFDPPKWLIAASGAIMANNERHFRQAQLKKNPCGSKRWRR